MNPPTNPSIAVAIAIVRRNSLWLVARRHDHAHLGGLWEFPGGKIEANESAEAAAVRELAEECGLAATAIERLPVVECEYPDRRVTIVPVRCQAHAGTATAIGSAEVRWITSSELRDLEMPAANAPIIAALLSLD